MLIANVGGERQRATKSLHKEQACSCPGCGQPVIARCGEQKVNHWAHVAKTDCPVGAGETEWHLGLKSLANDHEIEVTLPHWAHNRADVCLDLGADYLVVELQHSGISENEILKREEAYQQMVWVVDVKDRPGFSLYGEKRFKWKHASTVWNAADAPVIFDTGEKWVVHLGFKWRKWFDGDWRLLHADVTGGAACVLPRPTNREELVRNVRVALQEIEDICRIFVKKEAEFEAKKVANKPNKTLTLSNEEHSRSLMQRLAKMNPVPVIEIMPGSAGDYRAKSLPGQE
jgi:competence protein CoiA-like protein